MNTLYSDIIANKNGNNSANNSVGLSSSSTPVIVLSDSDNGFCSQSESQEEDITTTVMRFNRIKSTEGGNALAGKKRRLTTKRKKAGKKEPEIVFCSSPNAADNSSDNDVKMLPNKKSDAVVTKRRHGGKRDSMSLKKNKTQKSISSLTASKDDGPSICLKEINGTDSNDVSTFYSSKRNSRENGNAANEKVSAQKCNSEPSRQNYETDDSFEEFDGEEVELVKSGIKQYTFFSTKDCAILEQMIDDEVVKKISTFKTCTVDRAPLRNKYFFGEGYTYGAQMKRKGPGMEELYPKGFVDDIPEWIVQFVIKPLEKAGIMPKDFVNSCVINDYLSGGCIISHIDPKQLFDRPIYTISLMSDSALSFGVKFTFKPIRCSEPVYRAPLKRGCITSISGYAADNITHCVRPQDTHHRRAVIILRRVFDDAPRLPPNFKLSSKEEPAKNRHNQQRYRRSAPAHHGYPHSSHSHGNRKRDASDSEDEYRHKKRSRRSEPLHEPRTQHSRSIRQ